jgi:hypothetical protein
MILGLLISTIGALALTASEYAECGALVPDELLDLALAWQYPVSHVFAPHLNTQPFPLSPLKISYFEKVNLLTSLMRC